MSFEDTLETVRALSEGSLKRDPDAKVYCPAPPPPPGPPLFVKNSRRHGQYGELVDVLREELAKLDQFTVPQLANLALYKAGERYAMVSIKSTAYAFVGRLEDSGDVAVLESSMDGPVAIYVNRRFGCARPCA